MCLKPFCKPQWYLACLKQHVHVSYLVYECYWLEVTNKLYHALLLQAFADMGKLLSKIFGNREMRILMLGLDAAGKTSIFAERNSSCSHYLQLHVLDLKSIYQQECIHVAINNFLSWFSWLMSWTSLLVIIFNCSSSKGECIFYP